MWIKLLFVSTLFKSWFVDSDPVRDPGPCPAACRRMAIIVDDTAERAVVGHVFRQGRHIPRQTSLHKTPLPPRLPPRPQRASPGNASPWKHVTPSPPRGDTPPPRCPAPVTTPPAFLYPPPICATIQPAPALVIKPEAVTRTVVSSRCAYHSIPPAHRQALFA
jgi:hypothetical protein